MTTLRKMWLKINGATRILTCDPDKDSLADVLRRIGLTGVKVGCNQGVCGACSVILNGELVRSCVKKIKNIPDYAEITTIEGIGTPNNLHPLQQAWITYGGVQCGFCTPGFIVSAYALLQHNPDPSREQVREWFQKNHNLCRCTGYKPLVDCVMAGAAVMRGEKTMDDIIYHYQDGESIYGSRHPKPTALEKVCGLCDFGDDIALRMPESTLFLAVVQPDTVHANITKIDYSKAEAMPGVVKVITAKDVKGSNRVTIPQDHPRASSDGNFRPVINDKKIFRHGDVVAVVAAHSKEQARAAAKEVVVEWDDLPVYPTVLESLAPDALQIHEETPNEFCSSRVIKGDDVEAIFSKAPYVTMGSFHSAREPHLPLEPDVMQAYWDEEGRMTVQCKSQNIHANKNQIAPAIGLPADKVRIIENPTGGSFGYTMCPSGPALVAACAMALDQPVSLTMNYAEHNWFTGKRAAAFINAKLACDEKGKILALKYDMCLDHGAYAETCSRLVDKCCRFIGNPYNVPNIRGIVRAALSNNAPGIMYRAFGSPQCYTASEALMDMMAEKLGMDPFEFRRINIARPGDTTVNSYPYREYPMEKMMDMLAPYYEEARAHVKDNDTDTVKHGLGVVWGGYHVGLYHDHVEVDLELNPDGTVTHYNSWEQQGQGADIGSLTHTHEALRELNLRPDQIKLIQNDTAITPNTGPASGSKSHYMVGRATIDAAEQLLSAMRKPDGTFRTYEEMAAEGIPTKYRGVSEIQPGETSFQQYDTGVGQGNPEANYLLLMATVAVDTVSGKVTVESVKAITDIGVVGNQLAVEGQQLGGLSHSIGFALSENFSSEQKKYGNLIGCGIPDIMSIPDDIDFIHHVTPRQRGPFGSSGCSESYQSVGHMAIVNAVKDAIGNRIYELPLTPDKVKAAIAGQNMLPEPYFFHNTFEEEWQYIDDNPIAPTVD